MEAQRPLESESPVKSNRKPSPKESSLDWVVALFCIVAGSIGLRMVNDSDFWNEFLSGRVLAVPLGKVVREAGGVRHRAGESPVWRDIRTQPQSVADGDLVFTGNDGKAELQMDDGNSVKILPNSLVVIQASLAAPEDDGMKLEKLLAPSSGGSRSVIDIKQGTVKLGVSKNSKSLEVSVRDKTFAITSESNDDATVEVSVGANEPVRITSGSESKLSVREGVGKNKNTFELGAGQAAEVKARGQTTVRTVLFQELRPAPSEQLVLPVMADNQVSVFFNWEWYQDRVSHLKLDDSLRLEIDGDAKKMYELSGKSEKTRILLKPGQYRWRLVKADSKGTAYESSWKELNVKALYAPRAVSPIQGSRILVQPKAQRPVVFTWDTLPDGVVGEVEVTEQPGTSDEKKNLYQGERSRVRVPLAEGDYEWKVRSVNKRGFSSPWSEARALTLSAAKVSDNSDSGMPLPASDIAKIEAAEPPEEIEIKNVPATTRLNSQSTLEEVPVVLRWKPVENAKKYDVVVFNKQNKVVLQKTTDKTSFRFLAKTAEHLSYRYQVKARVNSGREIASAMKAVDVLFAAPVLKQPIEGRKFLKDHDVLMTWEKTALTKEYRVQVASDASFKNVLFDQSDKENWRVLKPTGAGSYFWRVQSVNGARKSAWSNAFSFIVE